jgi:hypothetical protein
MNVKGRITTTLFVLLFFTSCKSNNEDISTDSGDAGVDPNDSASTDTESDTCEGCMSLDEPDVNISYDPRLDGLLRAVTVLETRLVELYENTESAIDTLAEVYGIETDGLILQEKAEEVRDALLFDSETFTTEGFGVCYDNADGPIADNDYSFNAQKWCENALGCDCDTRYDEERDIFSCEGTCLQECMGVCNCPGYSINHRECGGTDVCNGVCEGYCRGHCIGAATPTACDPTCSFSESCQPQARAASVVYQTIAIGKNVLFWSSGRPDLDYDDPEDAAYLSRTSDLDLGLSSLEWFARQLLRLTDSDYAESQGMVAATDLIHQYLERQAEEEFSSLDIASCRMACTEQTVEDAMERLSRIPNDADRSLSAIMAVITTAEFGLYDRDNLDAPCWSIPILSY